MIQPSEDRVFPALEDLLSWTSRRQQALAANVANQDTPGYRAKDYSFQEQLASITHGRNLGKTLDAPGGHTEDSLI